MKKIKLNLKLINVLIIILSLLFSKNDNATEILIYADEITYDSNKTITAKNNAKIIWEDQIIISDLVIYNQKNKKYYFPKGLTYKDQNGNYYQGTSGEFTSNFKHSEMENVKILLNDGSRIVGNKFKRNNEIDIISKAGFTPCKTKIKIGNFICPIWQIEGEKMIHDQEKLILYQKHSKLRFFKTPVFYSPYLITPSPLREKRKSGFLLPSGKISFLDDTIAQSITTPYYFAISDDKELYFKPTFKFGGGEDSSQTIGLNYYQLLSGGNLALNYLAATNLERSNNEKWLTDAFISFRYDQNLNETYKLKMNSSLQTSKEFLKNNEPDNKINYLSSLPQKVSLYGYNIKKIDDILHLNFSTYQSVKNHEDNKILPTVLPFIEYDNGIIYYKDYTLNNKFNSYNIVRDKGEGELSKQQQKFSYELNHEKEFYNNYTKFTFKNTGYTQIYNTEQIVINNNDVSSSTFRFFPISSIYAETPFKFKDYETTIYPQMSLVVSPGISNSNKISNEDSNNNSFNFNNAQELNRFTGTDKMDNSKRINYGATLINSNLKLDFYQNYEFSTNSNFNKYIGNKDHLSDWIANLHYHKNNNEINYFLRYDTHYDSFKTQNIEYNSENSIGEVNLYYTDEKKDNNIILADSIESLRYAYQSNEIKEYSKVNFSGIYDMRKDTNREYNIGYEYLDECFGVSVMFNRKFYEDGRVRTHDLLTILFSFKHLGNQEVISEDFDR